MCVDDAYVLNGICNNIDLCFSGHLSLCAHFLLDMKHANLELLQKILFESWSEPLTNI